VVDNRDDSADDELSPSEVRGWAEFACWTTLALAPFLYWVNGPAVSTDQFVVRTGLVVLAACGAVGLRGYAWLCRRRNSDR
jgi:hypothetical protein